MVIQIKQYEKNIDEEDRRTFPVYQTVSSEIKKNINEEQQLKFTRWVTSVVLPSIRKYGQFKLFDSPNNHMFKIENETDLHFKVVSYIRRFYPEAITVAGLGEVQDSSQIGINSWKKGYQKGQPDIIIQIQNYNLRMKKLYKSNGYRFKISNGYDKIIRLINSYFSDIRTPRK